MTANLPFSQVIFQNHSPDVEPAMTGVSVQNRSAVFKNCAGSSGESRKSFLNNLEQISKDHHSNSQTQRGGVGQSSPSPAYNSGDRFAAASHPATGSETGIFETTKQEEEDFDKVESFISPALNITADISILEKWGMCDSAGGSSSANKTEPSNLNQWIKMIVSGQEDQKGSSGVHHKESDCGEKLSDPFAKINRVTTKYPNDIRQTGPIHSAKDSQAAFRLENPEKIDSIKLAVAARAAGVEASGNVKESKSLETVCTDSSGFKGGLDISGKTGTPSQAGDRNRIWSTIDSGKQFGGESAAQNLSNNESSPVLKMIHNAQLSKENHLRMDAAMSGDLGGKITKVDVGANDSGLLSSQNQTSEKAFEAASPSMQTDPGQDSLRTQTLDQIVRKAVIYMRNGQHEAKIDLKPDFLGHVRMQVTIDNQQVTVKILTESGFVKDMVENNIHQLKADLQQQGLNVYKLEVAVSSDSDDDKHSQEKAGQAKDRQCSVASINPGNREEEAREQAGNLGLRKAGAAAVDYFA